MAPAGSPHGTTADEVAGQVGVQRHNASADLNELCRDGLAIKSNGRPVRFWAAAASVAAASVAAAPQETGVAVPAAATSLATAAAPAAVTAASPAADRPKGLADLVGADGSLMGAVEQAKAAMLYPPMGLPTLIVGPTGAGKSRLAEAMYLYAVESGRLARSAPFRVFNCADYASNPQLLLSQLFGHVRGAFTGADRESPGLIAETNGGVLFLDEVHRLPPEGQEMLFLLMDKGVYRPLGDSASSRRASVTLLAATSEDPGSTLLRTFLRRFPVVITLPDLESRSLKERLALVELFLREEASRVGLPVSVSPLVLVALLSFRTAANVGELRSAVLLGCARAFLSHMATNATAPTMQLALTHLAPHVQLAYLGGDVTGEAEALVGVEDRLYRPAATAGATRDDYVLGDIYAEMRRRVDGYLRSGLQPREVQRLIQTDMDYYVRRLAKRSGGAQPVPAELLDVVSEFVRSAGLQLGREFEPEVVTGLTLHFVSRTVGDAAEEEGSLALVAHCPREYGVVRRLAPALETGLGMSLGSGEIVFLALFLAAHGRTEQQRPGVTVLVMAHGASTAASMADVANQLLDDRRVLAVDMPLDQSVEQTLQLAIQRVREAGPTTGVLLLADMGSLTGFGPALGKALGVPAAVVPLVTTAAVIEAGRLAAEPDQTLADIVWAVRRVYSPEEPAPMDWEGKRVIITTCLTGQGTARKLAAFLREALPVELHEQVVIQPVDLTDGSQLPGLLVEGWRGSVLAAAGTVDPHLPGVSFIGMEQILFGEGIQSLVALAAGQEPTQPQDRDGEHFTRAQAVELASRFACENIAGIDGPQASAAAIKALELLEEKLAQRCTPGQAARWIIHFAFGLERLAAGGAVPSCGELPYLQEQHAALLAAVRSVTAEVVRPWVPVMPESEIGYLALIFLSA